MIADRYLQLKNELESGLTGLINLGAEMERPSEQFDTLHALLRDISEPLLFVIVGEVKSGKSSLLNALFGDEFAKVDVLPATDRVYIFRYGPEEKIVEISPRLTERYLPIPFLRNFNVVDTPGTNTMVKEHQMTTEDFMPRADIVLFVFSVANPWTQSNWEFLNFLQKTWLKNVIFVLQQIDLREPTEIEVIHRHLQDTAMRQLGFVPPIFAVSARKALLAQTSGLDKDRLWQESAFAPLQDQINFIVTESSTRMLKLRSTFHTARVTMEDLAREISGFLEKISIDAAALNRLDVLLQHRRDQMRRQIAGLLRDLEGHHEKTTKERTKLLRGKLPWWSPFKLIFSRAPDQRELQAGIQSGLSELMQPQMEKAANLLETDLRSVWPEVQDFVENELSADLRKEAHPNIPDFSGHRRELFDAIQASFAKILGGELLQLRLARSSASHSIALRIVGGMSVIAVIGWFLLKDRYSSIAIAAVVVAAVGVLIVILLALNHRHRIVRDYECELDPKRVELRQELEGQFEKAIDSFWGAMSKRLQQLTNICQTRRDRYEPWSRRIEELQTQFAQLKPRLG